MHLSDNELIARTCEGGPNLGKLKLPGGKEAAEDSEGGNISQGFTRPLPQHTSPFPDTTRACVREARMMRPGAQQLLLLFSCLHSSGTVRDKLCC
ncbi:hypothetical protein PoB_003092600 [Plakobranchus ocellatus]|uniref:Uncharacterized protein n=1 Tax=Plakobranchus ocellatus TaxID=259542 RepID=A0AAV3ZZL8_9GAST|nr:hypothetical protein PoB_003092600 [Plakobranchus ocellatus]